MPSLRLVLCFIFSCQGLCSSSLECSVCVYHRNESWIYAGSYTELGVHFVELSPLWNSPQLSGLCPIVRMMCFSRSFSCPCHSKRSRGKKRGFSPTTRGTPGTRFLASSVYRDSVSLGVLAACTTTTTASLGTHFT